MLVHACAVIAASNLNGRVQVFRRLAVDGELSCITITQINLAAHLVWPLDEDGCVVRGPCSVVNLSTGERAHWSMVYLYRAHHSH